MLKDNVLWPKSRRFKSQTEWEPIGFFSEGLCNATQFDLKLGFFSSTAINVLADGFALFIHNGGRMRMVINDILSEEDQNAFQVGDSDIDLPFFDLENIENLEHVLSERSRHFFECLAWLIRNDRIEIKIVALKGGEGIAHTKCGLFSDGLNRVAFDGSCNFSRTAFLFNKENITAFCDWDGESDRNKIDDIAEDFERTFSGNDETVTYVDAKHLRDSITNSFSQKDIKELLDDEVVLIEKQSKEAISPYVQNVLSRAKTKVNRIIEKERDLEDSSIIPTHNEDPRFPFDEPRPYQKQAYENWKSNDQKGLFAMATGTGKTLTSLNCLLNIYKKFHFYKALILVPTITLVDQWEVECKKFRFKNIVKVCSKNNNWKNEIDNIKSKEEFNLSDEEPSYIIIATYASFARETIYHELIGFNKKATKQILLIADEAHNMGAGRIFRSTFWCKVSSKNRTFCYARKTI